MLWYAHKPYSGRPYRYANKHFYEYMESGSRILESKVQNSTKVLVTAVLQSDNKLSVIIQNLSTKEISIGITGLPIDTFQWIRTKKDHYYEVKGNVIPVQDTLKLNLAPNSFHTIQNIIVNESDEIIDGNVSENPVVNLKNNTINKASVNFSDNYLRLFNVNSVQSEMECEILSIDGKRITSVHLQPEGETGNFISSAPLVLQDGIYLICLKNSGDRAFTFIAATSK
ncbi:MAG: hypothetical protein HC906_10765 [Bacteroidales bacterium]|nr:hypothetical protein [Bacteroidales bacterium]